LLHVTLQFISRYRRPADCAALNRPAMHMLLLALHKTMAMLSLLQLTSPRVPSPHELPTVLPSPFKTGRRQRDYCAIRKASGDDSRGLSTQVSRRISSQLKRDCADPRERSRSIIAASQNLRPMTCRRGLWGLRSRSKIDRQSSPSASSAPCGRRLNKSVCPRPSWMLEWLKWFVDTEPN
jgi:hypothetical protein